MRVASIVLNEFTHDSRVLKEARSLSELGHEVTVVAMHAEGLAEHERVEGFVVHRIRLASRSWSRLPVVQVVKYLEFLVRALRHHRQADVFHCHDLSALPIGVLGRSLFNRRAHVVYDAHEFETEIEHLTPTTKWLSKILERLLIKHVDQMITVSDPIADDYAARYGIARPHLVLNTPEFTPIARSNRLREALNIGDDRFLFLFQGALSPRRGIELMLETAATHPMDGFVFVFMGYGPLEQHIKDFADTNANVFHKSAVLPAELLGYTASADCGLLLFDASSLNNVYAMPNKLFEYLMGGLPVICSSNRTIREFVEQHEVGVVLHAFEPAALLDAMHQIVALDHSRIAANIDRVRNHYNWEAQAAVLAKVYGCLDG